MRRHKRGQRLQRQIVRRRISPQARRRRRLIKAISTLVLVALLAAGGWVSYPYLWDALCSTSYLKVTRITFAGLQRVSEKELRALLPQIGGINLFSLDLEILKAKLECHPWVESAALHRQLLDQLSIEITERKPIALLAREGLWAVDIQGTVLPLNGGRSDLDLPLVNLGPGPLPMPGVSLAEDRVLCLLPKLEALRARLPDLWQDISEVSWDDKGQIEFLALEQPVRILLGEEITWRQMLNFYTFLIYQGQKRGFADLDFVDLRFWGQVVVHHSSVQTDSSTSPAI